MRNGLYSMHIRMLDGVKGLDAGIMILRDGQLLAGGPYFWSVGRYSVGQGIDGRGTWKGEFITNQHTPFEDPAVRPLFGGQEVTSGFSGTFDGEGAEVFATTLAGKRSLNFRAVLRRLVDI
jgi:hypothetical protein